MVSTFNKGCRSFMVCSSEALIHLQLKLLLRFSSGANNINLVITYTASFVCEKNNSMIVESTFWGKSGDCSRSFTQNQTMV